MVHNLHVYDHSLGTFCCSFREISDMFLPDATQIQAINKQYRDEQEHFKVLYTVNKDIQVHLSSEQNLVYSEQVQSHPSTILTHCIHRLSSLSNLISQIVQSQPSTLLTHCAKQYKTERGNG
jgi:hypothetical protein